MGTCSYCYRYTPDECFGWGEAKTYCNISGPDDPVRRTRKRSHDESRIREAEREVEAKRAELADMERALSARRAEFQKEHCP